MSTNPIQYTSSDFQSVMNDIDSDNELKDKPSWWKRIWAGVRDVLGVQINSTANQSFLRTAFTRQSVADLAALIDYQLSTFTTALGNIIFHLNAATMSFPYTFAATDFISQSRATLVKGSKQFEARAGLTVTAVTETFTANAGDDKITVARLYTTGEKVRLTTAGTLPDPLHVNTDYYVIYVSATTIRLALTCDDAFNGIYIDLNDAGTGAHTIHLYSFVAVCYQQETKASSSLIGTSDGTTAWQQFFLPDQYVLDDTLVITINSLVWAKVSTFVNSLSTDKVYRVINLDKGMKAIMFGDGTYGEIPGNFPVYADYATGGTAASNVYVLNTVTAYAGGNVRISSSTNAEAITGGADEEALASAKVIAPMLLKARGRDITLDDTKFLVNAFPGVLRCGVNPNYYGLLTQQIVVVPSGGGAPAGSLLTDIEDMISPLTVFGDVVPADSLIYSKAVAPTYVPQSVTASVKIISGWTWATVQGYVVLALRLMFSEVTVEIQDILSSTGISDAVTYINNKWSTSFVSSDYNSIKRMLDNLLAPADFGMSWEQSDVDGFIDSFVDGVDYIIIAAPTFPITTAVYEITTDNINPTLITQI